MTDTLHILHRYQHKFIKNINHVSAKFIKNARLISWSKLLRGTIFKPCRRQRGLVLLYIAHSIRGD